MNPRINSVFIKGVTAIAAILLGFGAVKLRAADPATKTLPLPGEVFQVQGHPAFVIPPARRAANQPTPWVWYAPTLPGLPGKEERWMFERFTKAGIAIAGIDVGESYGSPDGRKLFTALYDELVTRRGFAPKPVLLGRSRGGLMALNWAAENPEKVGGFAGIYPVCSFVSWPGLEKASPAYGLTPEELGARLAEHNPIDRLAPLAKAGVPLFAIHGNADEVVPLEGNSGEMRKRYEVLGGKMQLIVPRGQGHSMWEGFFQNQPLVEFVLANAKPLPPPARAELAIDTTAPTRPYSPMLFGGFLEHFDHQIYGGVFDPGSPLADKNGFRRDVMAALKELKVPVLRWPGGCFASGYHWEGGVGKTRQPADDLAWGVIEPNTFGTDEFVELCRRMNWLPYICNNAGNGTVEEMRNWVEYCNAKDGRYAQLRKASGYARPRNVPLWSIGNENWGGHEIGNKPIKEWAPLVAEAARAMKAVDPNVQLSAAASPTREWTLPLLQQAGAYLDYISIHKYWLPLWGKNDMPDYTSCIVKSEGPEQMIADYIAVLAEAGYRGRIKIAFDEWNLRGWHHEGFPRKTVQSYNDPEVQRLVAAREKNHIASQYTMADALFAASFLNACLRHAEDVGMANIAPLVNTRGPLFVHPKGIVKRTHFHTLAMYANELESRVAKLSLNSDPLIHTGKSVAAVDVIATVNDSGKRWAIALINRDPQNEIACTVKLDEHPLNGRYRATQLSGDSPDAFNDIEHPNRVTPQSIKLTFTDGVTKLPPHSLTIAKLSR